MLSTKVNAMLWRPFWRHISTTPQLLRSNNCEQKGGGIRDKAGLITGGASGIGLQCARALLKCGARGVTIADCDNDRGETALKELAEEFGNDKAVFVHCDVTKSELVDWAFKTTLNAFNRLDIVINSAGVLNDRVWENEIHTNICGTMVGNLLGLQYMAAHCAGKGGFVVNICSTMGLSPFCGAPIYSMTQAAILGLTRALGKGSHLERTKVKVMGVAAGLTETPLMVNATKNTINTRFSADFKKDLQCRKWQRPEVVANTVLAAIKDGEAGSLWVVEHGCKPYKICIPCYVDLKAASGTETVLDCLLPAKKKKPKRKEIEPKAEKVKAKVSAVAAPKPGEKKPEQKKAAPPPPPQPKPPEAKKQDPAPKAEAKPAKRSKSHGSCGSCPEPKWHHGEPPKKEKPKKEKQKKKKPKAKDDSCDACAVELKYKHKESKAKKKKKKKMKPPITKVRYAGKCKDKAKGDKPGEPPKGGKPPAKAPAKPTAGKPAESGPPKKKSKEEEDDCRSEGDNELSFDCECEKNERKKRANRSAH